MVIQLYIFELPTYNIIHDDMKYIYKMEKVDNAVFTFNLPHYVDSFITETLEC